LGTFLVRLRKSPPTRGIAHGGVRSDIVECSGLRNRPSKEEVPMNAIHTRHARLTRRALFLGLLLPAVARAATWISEHENHSPEARGVDRAEPAFSDDDAAAIQTYYKTATADGRCPPGLTRNGNSCLPPGQSRRWMLGQVLPSAVPAEPLPPDLSARLHPMFGWHYVRVGGDILMVSDGTRIVGAGMPDLVR
jgi:hypothetical protein